MIPIAERRMFSKRIINSARFLKMPVSTQCLYFHLGLHADDDGVVEAYTVLSSVGATEDDLKILVAKGFLTVLNEDLVSYINDWRENNKIRSDRKIDSIYKDLLVQMLPEVELLEARNRTDNENRSKMYKESELPNKFLGVMRGLFYGERCPICGCKMEDGNTKPSIQHNLPISKGGKHEIDNISVICLSCNMSLKDKETGELNNALVKEKWEHYLAATCEDSVRTTKGLTEDGIGKDRIGKDSIVKDRIKKSAEALFDEIEDEELKSLYIDFYEMRKKMKAPMTEKAVKLLINKVGSLEQDVERQKMLLNEAILHGWKSVYPLKDNVNARKNSQTALSQADREFVEYLEGR